jgi:hypothetical protein
MQHTGQALQRASSRYLPEPEANVNAEVVEDMPVLELSKLIEVKTACGLGNVRRTHKDLADAVELIAIRNLDSSFSRHLHKSVRSTFLDLVRNAGHLWRHVNATFSKRLGSSGPYVKNA